ncbi:MAG: PDZ domain-containing protein, partial [Planctomycetota bacterium]|nr:PDZ domain-containing protein [Planctomycetota bacterium]
MAQNGRGALWLMVMAAAAQCWGAEDAKRDLTPQDLAKILEAQRGALVRVEYTLQPDKGDEPEVAGWGERCANCGRYHGVSASDFIKKERPLALPGFVIASDRVISPDPIIPARFVKKIEIRCGVEVIPGQISAYGLNQNAVIIRSAAALKAKPLTFAADRKPPYFAVTYAEENGEWNACIKPFSGPVAHADKRGFFMAAPPSCLVVDETGAAVGLGFRDEVTADDAWKGSPDAWPWLTAEEMAAKQQVLAQNLEKSLLRVTLKFRSPRKQAGGRYRFRFSGDDDDEKEATERHVAGLAMDEKTLLILALLKPAVTARLERIIAHAPDGKAIAARFKSTLADYGCLVAEAESPLPGALPVADKDILEFRHALLLAGDVRIQGEKRVLYLDRGRIASFAIDWRSQVYPELRGESERLFLFDLEGRAVVAPVIRREKVAARERYSREQPQSTPLAYVRACLADLAKHGDPNNAPRTEAEENRLAWLGAELQPLNQELARANKVSDLTKDGEFGAMVAFVYPDSPAARAGVEAGWILLRLHVEGQPKPLEVKIDEDYEGRNFPWEQLDRVPEQYFEEIPQPWQ